MAGVRVRSVVVRLKDGRVLSGIVIDVGGGLAVEALNALMQTYGDRVAEAEMKDLGEVPAPRVEVVGPERPEGTLTKKYVPVPIDEDEEVEEE